MTILVSGCAGFIGYHVSLQLLERGDKVTGIDNLNNYYDLKLKETRLTKLKKYSGFTFLKADIADIDAIDDIVDKNRDIEMIVHLAAQAGVRYSLINPHAYIRANVQGQLVMLEAARKLPKLKHFVYASSSSVYGSNKKLPFSISDSTDTPVSLYAATKKSGEMHAHAYAHIYQIPTTGLRFFTVYGPWGRPDMAAYIFVRRILAREPIDIFNHGNMRRDFTYIDDIVSGVLSCLDNPPIANRMEVSARLYNIGNHRSESLMDFISIIEDELKIKAKKNFLPLQPGDVPETFADISSLQHDFGFSPKTPISIGLPRFVRWYRDYHEV
ncbi:MAG: UDP-N-acetylglucosamine 4-epimerase [Alphaproteobacteria bacterium MarineAlpha3_Bin5]|nr:protein CapI [Magnetovibrio sp.]PPR80084.1 MAG: UDP-N-acetylglucosamine 4-epimerase [Alphaproteobacteria bacterium MarineAlpha3_Bin5]